MKKIIYIGISLFLSCSISFAQDKKQPIKYVYQSGIHTQESIKELNSLTKNDKDLRLKVLQKIKVLESQGKTILSTKEYAPIKARILSVSKNPSNPVEVEEKAYAQKSKSRYIVITELLK